MRELRIGLVGPGTIGQIHAQAIAYLDGLKLAAIAGGTTEELAALAPSAEVLLFEDAAAMVAGCELDAVVVTTPSGTHFEPARLALEAGRHVMVEKPLCVSLDEAIELTRLAKSTGLVASTVSQRRLEAQHQDIHRRLTAGELGQARLIEGHVHWYRSEDYYAARPWRRLDAQGGGSLFNQGIHTLDLMLWLFGPVRSVIAVDGRLGHDHEAEDTVSATLVFESGALGTLITSTATPPGLPAGLAFFTDRGSASIEHTTIGRWDFGGLPAPALADPGIASGAGDQVSIGIAGHVDQWRDFRDAILAGRQPTVTFEDGLMATRVITAIYRSAAEGRAIALSEIAGV